jgi:murein DD-endopeptidase MepM/ murein hydrolase activator NlpD
MSKFKGYKLNPETLLYEIKEVSRKSRYIKGFAVIVAGTSLFVLYLWLYTSVLGMDLPKTVILKKNNAHWASKVELMNRRLDNDDAVLAGLQMRDDNIYRSLFGMNDISPEVRNAGFGGVDRYAFLDAIDHNSQLKRTAVRLDVLTKKTYVQSKSFDEVAAVSKRAGDMASCIPAIPPINPNPASYRQSSPFGYRRDPFTGASKMHTGNDFACHDGNPVYATGDGTVENVSFDFFGYGNSVTVNHGFGYKTRYAHMSIINVVEGMKIRRGDCLGQSGNSGRSTGSHLHYEVIYKGNYVNPSNYYDLEMSPKEYAELVNARAKDSKVDLQPFHRRR